MRSEKKRIIIAILRFKFGLNALNVNLCMIGYIPETKNWETSLEKYTSVL